MMLVKDTDRSPLCYLILIVAFNSWKISTRNCYTQRLVQTRSSTSLEFTKKAGSWNSTLALLKPLVQARTRQQGARHDDTLRVKRNASMCHWNLFEVGEAIRLQEEIRRARWIRRTAFFDWRYPIKPRHIPYLLALSDLSQTLWLAGQYSLSRRVGERAVTGLTAHFGETHLATLDAMFHLGRTYRHMGLLEEAHRLLMFVLRKRKDLLGRTNFNHPDMLMVRNEVGMSLCSRRHQLSLAERIVRNVLKARERALGEEHAYTLWSVNDLAKVLSVRGQPEKAVKILQKTLPTVSRTLGDHHVGMRMHKGNLARAYAQCHEWTAAERYLRDIIPDIGEDHPDWAQTRIGLARIQIRLQEMDKAEQTCEEVLMRLKLERPNDARSRARTTAGLLAVIYEFQGDTDKMRNLQAQHPDYEDRVMDHEFKLM